MYRKISRSSRVFGKTGKRMGMLSPTVRLGALALVGAVLVANASADMIIGGVSYNDDGQATMTSADGSHRVSVNNTIDENGNVSIYVTGINVNAGTTYDSASFNLQGTVSPLSRVLVDAGLASDENEAYGLRVGSGLTSPATSVI